MSESPSLPPEHHLYRLYEALRQEVTEIRVDVKSYIKNLKVFAGALSILVAIVGFFGYGSFRSLQLEILSRANDRLAKTDALLSKVDERRIEEINKRLAEKEKEYTLTIRRFEAVVSKNKELEKRLLETLPPNRRAEALNVAYIDDSAQGYFEVKSFPAKFRQNEKFDFYLVFEESYELNRVLFLKVEILRSDGGRNLTLFRDYTFHPQGRLNKLPATFDVGKGTYLLKIGFLTRKGSQYHSYSLEKGIEVQ